MNPGVHSIDDNRHKDNEANNYGNEAFQNPGNEANYGYGDEASYNYGKTTIITAAATAAVETNSTQLCAIQLMVTGAIYTSHPSR